VSMAAVPPYRRNGQPCEVLPLKLFLIDSFNLETAVFKSYSIRIK